MTTPSPKKPDRFYDFKNMNVVFAWGSLALLVVTVWMLYDDYKKPWKRLQAQFRDLERAQLLEETEAERQKLDETQISAVEQQIAAEEAALAQHRDEIGRLEGDLGRLESKVYEADAASRATKSLLDTARYRYGEAVVGGDPGEVEETRRRVEELSGELREERKTLEGLTEQRDQVREQLASRRSGVGEAGGRLAELRRDLESLERRVANLDKTLSYFVLNAPVMDFIQPDLDVQQVVLSGLFHDINFVDISRVDRCVTCHVAATRPGFDGEPWEEPFRSHPRLELFVSDTSPHPYTEYGCTVCHAGLDRATDFARAGHSPLGEEARAAWTERWDWEAQKYLDAPILPARFSEAGCIGCHAPEVWTPGSQVQEVGRELITRMGCFGCHVIDYPAFTDLAKVGPDLRRVAAKTTREWAYRWIEAPRAFHPTTFMPHFFFGENIQGERNLERQRAEIRALVAFLWDRSERRAYPEPPAGDRLRGRQLFETVGCQGCHVLEREATRDQFFPDVQRLHGPNLARTGSKVSAGWLYAWLKDPEQYSPATRMPSLRLTDGEAADLTAFLMADRDPEYEGLELPAVDAAVRDELVLRYLQNKQTIEGSQAILAGMSSPERDVYLGEQSVQKYGCYGCHDIEGFAAAKPIGVELTTEGSKPLHQFDFGHVHDVPHTRHEWIRAKLLRPRVWDHQKETVKDYDELYKMPDFGMSEREADAVLTNVLGFTQEGVVASRKAGQGSRGAALARGRKLVTRYNCQGCHLIEGRGRAIRTAIQDPGLLPPDLAAEGARVQSGWLFDYLHDPGTVTMRPWLTVRMPTFGFEDSEVNGIVQYFAARDQRQPFLSALAAPRPRDLAVGEVLFGMLQCARCHPAGSDAAAALGISAAELAPSLLLAPDRLRHDWVASWIKDPQSWVTGTNMPSNFPRRGDGAYTSPLVQAIDAPMFAQQKAVMMRHFAGDEELKAYLGDVDQVTLSLRDHIWGLSR